MYKFLYKFFRGKMGKKVEKLCVLALFFKAIAPKIGLKSAEFQT